MVEQKLQVSHPEVESAHPRMPASLYTKLDGWMDGLTDGRTDGCVDGWIDRLMRTYVRSTYRYDMITIYIYIHSIYI